MKCNPKNPKPTSDFPTHPTFSLLVTVLAGQAAAEALAEHTPANDNYADGSKSNVKA